MAGNLVCWKCGAGLDDVPMPLGRLAECPRCRTELHVCLSCVFYDTKLAKQCREPIAEEVKDKARANFCDYFELRPDAYQAQDDSAARAARAQLDALFGNTPVAGENPATEPRPDAQRARDALDDLFGKPKDPR